MGKNELDEIRKSLENLKSHYINKFEYESNAINENKMLDHIKELNNLIDATNAINTY